MEENKNEPLVSFGFVNCNRLFYLKSCVESVLKTTSDYSNKEFIIVDNASVEPGTEEYLKEKERQGFKIIKKEKRDPSNEFAKALNEICKVSKGKYVVPLQGDSQFIIKEGWLNEYVDFYEKDLNNQVGCITLDAQRNITNKSHQYSNVYRSKSGFGFLVDLHRPPTCGAADVMYSREILNIILPWEEDMENFEYENDSETAMLNKVKKMHMSGEHVFFTFCPIMPVSIAIYTDPRGTNARIRKDKIYGKYWESKKDNQYYEMFSFKECLDSFEFEKRDIPIGIEEIAKCIGHGPYLDNNGNWLKNPIKPESCNREDWRYINE